MSNYTILIIDYDPRSIEALRAPLARAGFEVEIANDGLAGIRRFHQVHPDVTLVEAMLPKRHGFEVCQELKASQHGKKAAVFIVTSVYKGRRYRYQARDQHRCDEFLEKPLSDEKLLEVVTKYVSLPTKIEETPVEPDPGDAVISIQAVDDDSPAMGFDLAEPAESAEPAEPVVPREITEFRRNDLLAKSGHQPTPPATKGATHRVGRSSAAAATVRATRPRPVKRPRPVRPRPQSSSSRSVSHDRMMLWLAAFLLTVLGVLLAFTVLR